jgi:hypothetical protein
MCNILSIIVYLHCKGFNYSCLMILDNNITIGYYFISVNRVDLAVPG